MAEENIVTVEFVPTNLAKDGLASNKEQENVNKLAPPVGNSEIVLLASSCSQSHEHEVENQIELSVFRSKRPKMYISTRKSKTEVMHHKSNSGFRCKECKQNLNDEYLILYSSHPNGAQDEYNTLIDPKLSLFTGNEETVDVKDLRAVNRITSFRYVFHISFKILLQKVRCRKKCLL